MSNHNCTLTQDRLKERISYDKESGIFTWTKTVTGVKLTDCVGYVTKYGYRVIMLDKKNHFAHRLAWLYVYGVWPDKLIDHINGIKTDNRICNLRVVNKSENAQNMKKAKIDNRSGLLGAHKHGNNGWRSSIQINGKTIRLGTFRSPELAHEAYINAKRMLHPMNTI